MKLYTNHLSPHLGKSEGNDPQPMIEMNTTPLIDVMLVLLVMLIITIPKIGRASCRERVLMPV